jgi:hypothetical protein
MRAARIAAAAKIMICTASASQMKVLPPPEGFPTTLSPKESSHNAVIDKELSTNCFFNY